MSTMGELDKRLVPSSFGGCLVNACGHSYLEGIVRGYRNGLLTSNNYANLTQCETIDGTH
jgi:hypothetical protein